MNLINEIFEVLITMYPNVEFEIRHDYIANPRFSYLGDAAELYVNNTSIAILYTKGYVRGFTSTYPACRTDDERVEYIHYIISFVNDQLRYHNYPTIKRKCATI